MTQQSFTSHDCRMIDSQSAILLLDFISLLHQGPCGTLRSCVRTLQTAEVSFGTKEGRNIFFFKYYAWRTTMDIALLSRRLRYL